MSTSLERVPGTMIGGVDSDGVYRASGTEASPVPASISVVIPALNEGERIAAAVRSALRQVPRPLEVLVVDGGSGDGTVHEARAAGARVLAAPRGRGRQLGAGAAAARGDVFVFLHADTVLPPGALAAVARALFERDAAGGRFRLAFDRRHPVLDLIAWGSRFRARGAAYGDAAFFARRDRYEASGGYEAVPLFEDVRFYRRLARTGRLAVLPLAVRTSSRRFLRRGPLRQLLANALLVAAHALGASPERLARRYAAGDGPRGRPIA